MIVGRSDCDRRGERVDTDEGGAFVASLAQAPVEP